MTLGLRLVRKSPTGPSRCRPLGRREPRWEHRRMVQVRDRPLPATPFRLFQPESLRPTHPRPAGSPDHALHERRRCPGLTPNLPRLWGQRVRPASHRRVPPGQPLRQRLRVRRVRPPTLAPGSRPPVPLRPVQGWPRHRPWWDQMPSREQAPRIQVPIRQRGCQRLIPQRLRPPPV